MICSKSWYDSVWKCWGSEEQINLLRNLSTAFLCCYFSSFASYFLKASLLSNKYTHSILSNSTRKLLWFEITKMLVAVKKNKFIVLFIITFGTVLFPADVQVCMRADWWRLDRTRDSVDCCRRRCSVRSFVSSSEWYFSALYHNSPRLRALTDTLQPTHTSGSSHKR